MESTNWIKIGAIFFVIGFILILISWIFTYPIYISNINEITFTQFYPILWPGIVICLLALFIILYYCKSKTIAAICCSVIPLFLYVFSFFFSYIPSSDSGAARGMFQVFYKTGLNSRVNPYFEFPNYFSLNEIIHQVVGFNEIGIALISFTLYGVLLGLFLYLFFFNLMKEQYIQFMPFLMVFIYFIGTFSFLNYQWVPQTLALVYFFLLIYVSTYMLSNPIKTKWNFLFVFLFIPLLFTHPFLPVIFLLFVGILTIKRRYLLSILLVMVSLYLIWTIYHTTINFQIYTATFEQSINGFSGQYVSSVSRSFSETGGLTDQIISFINRITIPMIWIVSSIGILILFLKKKINPVLISLGSAGFLYLSVGIFYSVLGLRAIQILFIPLTIGFMFFIIKWKKPSVVFIVFILVLSVFGPMRTAYNNTQFQTNEDAVACDFLGTKIVNVTNAKVALSQVNWGYSTSKYKFLTDSAIRPGSSRFLFFKDSLNQKEYIVYNSNLGKEILEYVLTKEQLNSKVRDFNFNNKIYDVGTTFVIKGISRT